MFNKSLTIIQPTRSVGPSHVTIKEHRAPTDESVKLLREMEDKAKKSVEAENKIEETVATIKAQMIVDAADCSRKMKAIVSLNGKKLFIEHSIDLTDRKQPIEIMTGFRDEVAKQIANELLRMVEPMTFEPLFRNYRL